jgi:hypothetical protein
LVLAEIVGGRDILDTWVPIDGFDPYEVSDQGVVRNSNTGRILKQYDNGRDTIFVTLSRGGQKYSKSVRRLVATTFIGEPMEDDVAIPIDGDYSNNRADNLVWKPMWFAVRVKAQRRRTEPLYSFRIEEIATGRIFENSLEAANALDKLEDDIVRAVDVGYRYQRLIF